MAGSIHKVSTLLVLVIGIVHTVSVFFFYSSLSEAAIWFAGAGLGFIFAALLNIGLWSRDTSVLSRRLAAMANFLLFFWLVAGVSATTGTPQILVAAIGAVMVISAPLLKHRNRE